MSNSSKTCPCCEKNLDIKENFTFRNKKKDLYAAYCRKCRSIKRKKWGPKYRQKNQEKIREYNRNRHHQNKNDPSFVFKEYCKGAKRRNIPFNLTLADIQSFQNKTCFYCCEIPDRIGIDRVDNNVAYNISNCVACCSLCNRMKKDLSLQRWLGHMKKILDSRL